MSTNGFNLTQANYQIVDLDQGTADWHEWRGNGIGASEAPAIMRENPWKSPASLLREKLSGSGGFRGNERMRRGQQLEPEARARYEAEFGVQVVPACLQSSRFAWQRASVDGLAPDGSLVVEIKCGESVYERTRDSGTVPRYYYGQLQHILAVTQLDSIDFYCYLPRRPEICLKVDRDDDYISKLITAELAFWEQLQSRRSR